MDRGAWQITVTESDMTHTHTYTHTLVDLTAQVEAWNVSPWLAAFLNFCVCNEKEILELPQPTPLNTGSRVRLVKRATLG